MDKKLHLMHRVAVVLSSLLFLNSCRSTDTENVLSQSGSVAVNFRLTGSEYSGNDGLSGTASLNKGNLSGNVQSRSVLLTPSTVVTAEVLPSADNIKTIASVGNNSVAAIPGTALGNGTMYRVIAYRPDGSYHTYQDYTVGQPPVPMMLDNGVAYNLVCYSYGITTLPAISTGEQTNISSAQVSYDDTNRDFMYQKVNYTPTTTLTTNIFDFTLRHKVAQITTVINSFGLGNITAISGSVLMPHFSNGVFPLSTGVMTGRTTTTAGSSLSFSGLGTTQATAAPVFVNADTGGLATGDFSATSITIGGVAKPISISDFYKITPENKSTLTINFKRCGAYVGPTATDWKEFSCFNLGATTTGDPFAAIAANHGAKYQWGATTGETGRYVDQATDQSNSGTISGWLTTVKPDGSWSDTAKTASDPCPTGFMVPTLAQWQGVMANNTFTYTGSWTNSATNYSSGAKVGNNLFLPAAGFRDQSNGSLGARGSNGYYYSSSINTSSQSYYFVFNSTSNGVASQLRTYGRSVRCIAQ